MGLDDLKSLGLLALAGAGLYFVMRRAPPGTPPPDSTPDSVPPPPRGQEGPAFCESAHFGGKKTDAFLASFDRAWEAHGYRPGDFDGMTDALEKAHRIALWVMADVCPQLPRPKDRRLIENYAQKYGEAWTEAYETPFGWAYGRIVQMPV